jgi:hypothetical protein
MRFEVLTATKMSILVFWIVTQNYSDNGASMFLRNVSIYPQAHTAL